MIIANNAVRPVDPLEPEIKRKALRTLLWFGIVSITMLFAGLTSAYIVRQGEGKWVEFSLPQLFTISSVVIVLSSITMHWGLLSIRKNDTQKLKTALLLTLLLGIAFVFTQYYAWSELYEKGIVFTGTVGQIKTDYTYIPSGTETATQVSEAGNVAGSFLYVITGLHVVHLLAGLISLIVVFSRAMLGRYSAKDHNGVRMCSIYWHFLDGLWLYLFLFLLYIR